MAIDNSYAAELGRNIRDAREAAGIGLRELARLAKLSASYLCELEAGENIPSADKIQRIAQALRRPISKLLPTP
jgi:transcriptional regulator with XRE-family HTH domain